MSATPADGQHAQNALRLAIAANGNDWDRDDRKRTQIILELQALDQKIAGYQQNHRELSAALTVLDQIVPAIQRTQKTPPPDTAEFENVETPSRVPALFHVLLTPITPKEPTK